MSWQGEPWDPERPCVVFDTGKWPLKKTHLVMKDGKEEVQGKCGATGPRSDSYQGKYGNINCSGCRRLR